MLLMKAKEIKKSVGARELLNIKGLYLYKRRPCRACRKQWRRQVDAFAHTGRRGKG
jgi:hypothetical protein